jgi:hypothetical protein
MESAARYVQQMSNKRHERAKEKAAEHKPGGRFSGNFGAASRAPDCY